MAMNLIVPGEIFNSAAVLNRPTIQALTASGYAADGSDFAGYLPINGSGALAAPVTLTRTNVSGYDNLLNLHFDHLGGSPGGPVSQLGHGIQLVVTYTPVSNPSPRGMQAQKSTATIYGAIDNPGIDAMDLSLIIDATRTGRTTLALGISSVASKFNATDDTTVGGQLIAGQFVVNVHAGLTNAVGVQAGMTLGTGVSAPFFFGFQVIDPVIGSGSTVTTRSAGVEVGNWTTAFLQSAGGTVPRGMCFHAVGGDAVLDSGDVECVLLGTGFIQKSPNGTRMRIAISNAGVVTAAAA